MSKRKGIGKSTRFRIFARDRFTCQYCGRNPPAVVLEIDHVVAVSNGGTNSETNLLTACQDCNRGKSDRELSDIAKPDVKLLAKNLREKIEQIRQYENMLIEENLSLDSKVDDVERAWNELRLDNNQGPIEFTRLLRRSVKTFLKRLPLDSVIEAAEIAFSVPNDHAERWKYMCGICWNKIRGSTPKAENFA